MYLLLKMVVFHCYVSLPEGRWYLFGLRQIILELGRHLHLGWAINALDTNVSRSGKLYRGRDWTEKKCSCFASYCWWTESCTTKDDDYPIIHRVLTNPGGAGFLPSTVSRWWIDICLFSPLFREDEPILTNIFQMGWFNHQPDSDIIWDIHSGKIMNH